MAETPLIQRDVLLVDDDKATRRLFEHVLTRVGLSVVTAVDGVNALEVLATHRVDTIVLDLMMPRMSGFELLDRLIEARPAMLTRCIVLSAASLQWVDKASERPVWTVLRKPVDLDVFVQAVLDCLVQDSTGERKAARAAIVPPSSVRAVS